MGCNCLFKSYFIFYVSLILLKNSWRHTYLYLPTMLFMRNVEINFGYRIWIYMVALSFIKWSHSLLVFLFLTFSWLGLYQSNFSLILSLLFNNIFLDKLCLSFFVYFLLLYNLEYFCCQYISLDYEFIYLNLGLEKFNMLSYYYKYLSILFWVLI
jgi:hypothetical protein